MTQSWVPLAIVICFWTLIIHPICAATGSTTQDDAVNNGASTSSNSTGASWIFPSSSSTLAFDSSDTVKAQWSSHYTNPSLRLLCKPQNNQKFIQKNTTNVPPTGSQAVLLNVILEDSALCYFALVDVRNTSTSPSFTIKKAPNAAPHTWSANSPTAPATSIASTDATTPTATPTSTPVLTSSSSSFSTPSASASESASSSDSGGLSTGAGVGIGVGVAAAVVALAAGGLLLFLRVRQQKALRTNGMPDRHSKGMSNDKSIRVVPGIHETIGNRPVPQELDSLQTLGPSNDTLARSEFDRNEPAGQWPGQADTVDRAESVRSDGSSMPGSMRRGQTATPASPV